VARALSMARTLRTRPTQHHHHHARYIRAFDSWHANKRRLPRAWHPVPRTHRALKARVQLRRDGQRVGLGKNLMCWPG
jgi:hypothetical protein